MGNIKKFESFGGEKHLLVIYIESLDEIHFSICDYSLHDQILNSMESRELFTIIDDNQIYHKEFQSYTTNDIDISNFNIVKCIHVPGQH